jgi:hypothetical protein
MYSKYAVDVLYILLYAATTGFSQLTATNCLQKKNKSTGVFIRHNLAQGNLKNLPSTSESAYGTKGKELASTWGVGIGIGIGIGSVCVISHYANTFLNENRPNRPLANDNVVLN